MVEDRTYDVAILPLVVWNVKARGCRGSNEGGLERKGDKNSTGRE